MGKMILQKMMITKVKKADSKSADSESKGGAYLEMELHEGQNSETLGNDEAREGDATDDMTDMMTKRAKDQTIR